jgi:hypothetical protein
LCYSDCQLAIAGMRKGKRRDILLYLCTCTGEHCAKQMLFLRLPLVSPMYDYSIESRICIAG